MERINESQNLKTIKKLNQGLDRSWDLFLYGDKQSNTKPGNLQVYGTIVGQREVLNQRLKLQKEFEEQNNQSLY